MSDVERTRLHISGLTPKLSREDLLKRLSTFGQVSEEYFDPSGRGRWVFVTFESSKGNLRKCETSKFFQKWKLTQLHSKTGLNSLSGSTYKGAKLRIGEAKADYRERYEN
jgi:hypothetical protein